VIIVSVSSIAMAKSSVVLLALVAALLRTLRPEAVYDPRSFRGVRFAVGAAEAGVVFRTTRLEKAVNFIVVFC